jgi:hypothetical protein
MAFVVGEKVKVRQVLDCQDNDDLIVGQRGVVVGFNTEEDKCAITGEVFNIVVALEGIELPQYMNDTELESLDTPILKEV